MDRLMRFWLLGLLLALGVGCKSRHSASAGDALSALRMEYAGRIRIDSSEHYILVRVQNPWDTARILHTYVLVGRETELPEGLPEGTLVRTPVEKALVYSSVHCGLLSELGAIDRIGGICDLQYIEIPEIQNRCASGRMVDAGNAMNPDIEKIIDFHPDAILLSPFENSGGYGRIEKLGIPIIECADYMETSPLGRSEWMRFFGLLFGKRRQADSLFTAVRADYLQLCDLVKSVNQRPTVISELKSGSAWYVPGGKSTTGRLYQDAGATYMWAEDEHSGSIPLSFETVFDRGQDADFWLFKYNRQQDKTLTELKSDYASYAGFRAFQTGQVYGCNSGQVPFYTETPFHPERLLEDLIRIFHPGVLPAGECRYFKRLEK
ncbi:ABC transporter substrate-binding protein [Odoribacter splanchnicus]|jgi:iron complex transport system substrate-binding protein|uniref:ABC transporter substrate-binding protein n=1 Tax=Odoribacter splanchnicus TaxID=28118 RepID=A0A412TQK2_9BACT|nr:ABC transporter substrate-binding protein [Odoribacter splanchnicus]RGU56134.1 ABC transporter substrate-binding protein [Odoribacter splanchnicus]